jgi:hypothetical protein
MFYHTVFGITWDFCHLLIIPCCTQYNYVMFWTCGFQEVIEKVTSTDNRISLVLGDRPRLDGSNFVCERRDYCGDGCILRKISTLCDIYCINYYVETD